MIDIPKVHFNALAGYCRGPYARITADEDGFAVRWACTLSDRFATASSSSRKTEPAA